MIRGLGTDMVEISRIEQALARHGERFVRRILGPAEYAAFAASNSSACHLAKRFAAKEAASKALGTGIGRVSWHDIEVLNDAQGAPYLRFHRNAAARMAELGASSAWLSLSDEGGLALAFALIEGGP